MLFRTGLPNYVDEALILLARISRDLAAAAAAAAAAAGIVVRLREDRRIPLFIVACICSETCPEFCQFLSHSKIAVKGSPRARSTRSIEDPLGLDRLDRSGVP